MCAKKRTETKPKTEVKPARRFRFTWCNYTPANVEGLKAITAEKCDYLTFGFEICPTTGTPHLQGYIELNDSMRMGAVKELLDPTDGRKSKVNILNCDASKEQNTMYAQKTETKDPTAPVPFIEVIHREKHQGVRTVYHSLIEDIQKTPDFSTIMKLYPVQAIKSHTGIDRCIAAVKQEKMYELLRTRYPLNSPLYTWQRDVYQMVKSEASNRQIHWYYDPIGCYGKTWLAKFLVAHCNAIRFTNAASKDISYAYNNEPIVIMDFTRSNEGHINYGVMEMFNDGMMFSTKYASTFKMFDAPWVIVMANFLPNLDGCSKDRWRTHFLTGTPTLETEVMIDTSQEMEHFFNIDRPVEENVESSEIKALLLRASTTSIYRCEEDDLFDDIELDDSL